MVIAWGLFFVLQMCREQGVASRTSTVVIKALHLRTRLYGGVGARRCARR